MFKFDAPPTPQEASEEGPRRILVHPIHAAAVEQLSINRRLKDDYYLVEDKKGLHLGTLNTVFMRTSDIYTFVLNDGEQLEHPADAELQLFRPVTASGPDDLEVGDYLSDGRHSRLVRMIDASSDRLGEGSVQVVFEGEDRHSVFHRNDPEWTRLVVYRAADI
jgi:hypothetical protein